MQDPELLHKLYQGEAEAFRKLYRYFPMVRKMVYRNSGSEEDARDLFQQAVIVLYKNLLKPDFQLTSRISTYLYAICDKQWKKQLRQRQTAGEKLQDYDPHEETREEAEKRHQLSEVVDQTVRGMEEPCRSILLMHQYHKRDMEEIRQKLGYANAHTVRQQKYKCIQKLKKYLNNLLDGV